MEKEEIEVLVARPEHEIYVDTILETIAEAAKVRGTGIAKRTHEYIAKKMFEAKAVIARAVADSPWSIPGGPDAAEGAYSPVYFIAYADSSLVLATTVYYNPGTRTEVLKDDVNTRVRRALEAAGIEIPYNYVNVVLNDSRKG